MSRFSLLIGLGCVLATVAAELPPGAAQRSAPHKMILPTTSKWSLTTDGQYLTDGVTWFDLKSEKAVAPCAKLPNDASLRKKQGRFELVEILENGDLVYVTSTEYLRYDHATGKLKNTFEWSSRCAIDPSGQRLLRTQEFKKDKEVKVTIEIATWPALGEKPKWEVIATADGFVWTYEFNNTGSHAYWRAYKTLNEDKKHALYDFAQGQLLTIDTKIVDIEAVSNRGQFVAGWLGSSIALLDGKTGESVREVDVKMIKKYARETLRFTPDEKYLLAWGAHYHQLEIIPTNPKVAPRTVTLDVCHGIERVLIAADSKTAVIQDRDGVVRCCNLSTGKIISSEANRPNWAGIFWLDGERLLTWAHSGHVTIWNAKTLEPEKSYRIAIDPSQFQCVSSVRLSPNRQHLLYQLQRNDESDDKYRASTLMEALTGKVLAQFPKTDFSWEYLAFHPNGKEVHLPMNASNEEPPYKLNLRQYSLTTGEFRLVQLPDYYHEGFDYAHDCRTIFRKRHFEKSLKLSWEDPNNDVTRWTYETPRIHDDWLIDGREDSIFEDAIAGRVVVVHRGLLCIVETISGKQLHHQAFNGISLTTDRRFALGVKSWDDGTPILSLLDLRGQFAGKAPGEFVDVPIDVQPRSMAIAPDASRAVTLADDGSMTIWDLKKLRTLPPKRAALFDGWKELIGEQSGAAIKQLHANPATTIALFRQNVQPVALPNEEDLARNLRQLSSTDFRTREMAESWLKARVEAIRPRIAQAIKDNPSAEARDRLGRIEAQLKQPPTPDHRRMLLAVEILERLGTPEAKKLLEHWSTGAPGATLTKESQSSLERLKDRR